MCISSGEVGEGVRGVVGPKDIRNSSDVRGISFRYVTLCEQRPPRCALPATGMMSAQPVRISHTYPSPRKFRPNNTLGKFLRIFLQKRVHLPG